MTKLQKIASTLDFLANPFKDIEVFGMFGPGNLGDEAMLVAALQTLPPGRCTHWQDRAARPALKRLLDRRRRTHLLVGGGTLIHGGNTKWLDYVEMRARQGTRVSFFGTGIAFLPDQIATEAPPFRRWREVLRGSAEVHLRGPQSVDLARKMGAQAQVFGDFAFLLHDPALPLPDHAAREDTIGINLGNCLGDQAQFEAACTDLVRALARQHRLVFYAVVESDLEATRRVMQAAGLDEGRHPVRRFYFDPNAFMQSVRAHRAFIGLKLHAAGLAMVAGVPTLMVAYKPKSLDFMAPLGADSRMLLTLPMDAADTLARVEAMLADPAAFVVEPAIAALAASQRATLRRVYLS